MSTIGDSSQTSCVSDANVVASISIAIGSRSRRCKEFHSHRTRPVPSKHEIRQTSPTPENHNLV